MTLTAVQQIDQQIDAVHAELVRRVGFMPLDARGFGRAWKRNPTLQARERALFLARYDARQAEYAAEEKAAAKAKRAERRRIQNEPLFDRCPTCGCHTLDRTH